MADVTLVRGARVVDPASGRDGTIDVLVEEGTVAALGEVSIPRGATVLDCTGLVLAPGLVDLHAHLRQPGREDKETGPVRRRSADTRRWRPWPTPIPSPTTQP